LVHNLGAGGPIAGTILLYCEDDGRTRNDECAPNDKRMAASDRSVP